MKTRNPRMDGFMVGKEYEFLKRDIKDEWDGLNQEYMQKL